MSTIVIRGARVVTMEGAHASQSRSMPHGRVIPRGDVVVEGGMIERVEEHASQSRSMAHARVIEARGRVLMPAFVDAHTHAMWAGDRLDEWAMKRRGVPYLEILRAGGGIMSTVRAVRAASGEALASGLRARLESMLREGTTTVEVKSGYGLSTADELKMLRAIRSAAAGFDGTVVPTALLGHALDPDVPAGRFVQRTIEETLPAVHAEFPGIAVDAFCEEGAWPFEACVRLFERAMALGHPVRVHTDQFHALGMTEWAAANGALSVDHLEATSAEGLRPVAASGTYAVLLPCTGFHTDGRYADGRTLVEAGGGERVVIATNCNPGSSPCASMPMAAALAVRENRLEPGEALAAMTRNAAALLGFRDRGVIAPGKRADLVLLRHADERELAHSFGGDPVEMALCGGVVVRGG